MAEDKYIPMFPKPKDMPRVQEKVRVFRDGREVLNVSTKAGQAAYKERLLVAFQKQVGYCSICAERLTANAERGHSGPPKP